MSNSSPPAAAATTTTIQPHQFGQPPFMPPLASPLYKQKSWSPDVQRDEEWAKRKGKNDHRRRRWSKSVTDDDIDELKACIELGFGFDSPVLDDRLSDTFPALGFYHAVNKHYYDTISKSSSSGSSVSSYSSAVSEPDLSLSSPLGSPHTIFVRGDNPQTVKTRLRQWAQVVACLVRQSSSSSSSSSRS